MKNFTITHYIYLVRCDNAVKIGVSSLPEQRLQLIRTDNYKPVEVLGVFEVAYAYQLEKELHKVFYEEGRHIRGEWFKFTKPEIKKLVKSFEEIEV